MTPPPKPVSKLPEQPQEPQPDPAPSHVSQPEPELEPESEPASEAEPRPESASEAAPVPALAPGGLALVPAQEPEVSAGSALQTPMATSGRQDNLTPAAAAGPALEVGDDAVDSSGCTTTLLTTCFLLHSTPSKPGAGRVLGFLVVALAALVFTAQALFALKLVRNASDPDKEIIAEFLLEGYMALTPESGINCTAPALSERDCRLQMERRWVELLAERKASELATDLDDLPLCLTEDGLANGTVNMMAGMLIVAATVLLGVVEQLSGAYAVRSQSACWLAIALILFHVGLAGTLLYAARWRLATVSCDFWDVIETAVAVFLVVELDDLVLFCVKVSETVALN
jgi:hypothetical protein